MSVFLDPVLQTALAIALSTALLLVTAKAHGRQVRLRRELEGYTDITFTGDNPPWVEELWRRDRRRVWAAYATSAGTIIAYGIAATFLGWPRGNLGVDAGLPLVVAVPMAAILWGPTVGLVVSGTATAIEYVRVLRTKGSGSVPHPPLDAALRGTWAWWLAVALLASMVAAMVAI